VEALGRALERRREHYNALFVEAQRRSAELDPSDLLDHLRQRVLPIFQALPEISSDAEDRVLEVLYRSSLELLSRRLAGRHAARGTINAVWEQLLPRAARLVAVAPRRVVAALSNAASHLDGVPSARSNEWLERMSRAVAQCADLETLIGAGQVAAWRAGLCHFRPAALGLCHTLAPDVLDALLGWPPASRARALQRLESRRFLYPEGDALGLAAVGQLGGFTGFGGPFSRPPRLGTSDGLLLAYDHESSWEIHADAFGSLLRRAAVGLQPEPTPPAPFSVSSDGSVTWGPLAARFPAIVGATEVAAVEELLAVALPHSHQVLLIAVTQGHAC